MPFDAEPLILTEAERRELQQMKQSRMLPAGDVMRSRMILLLADGFSYQKIQDAVLSGTNVIAKELSVTRSSRHRGQSCRTQNGV
jgi:hypothetical protein